MRDRYIRKFSLQNFSSQDIPVPLNLLPDKERERGRIRTLQKVAYWYSSSEFKNKHIVQIDFLS